MDDKQIIDLFNERSEQAITELSKKYGKLCHKVALNILSDERDAQECVNDAYFALWNQIPPNCPDPLRAYLLKTVRNLAMERKRSNTVLKRNNASQIEFEEVNDIISDVDSTENAFDANELQGLIGTFLEGLDKNSRVMFIRRYWFCDTVENIAKTFGKSNHYVSVKLTRIKDNLKKYLKKEGFDI